MKKNKRRIVCMILGLVMLLSLHAAAQETTPKSLIFILDGSGSMWGRLEEDQPKISIAKDVMKQLIRDLPPETSAGLITYGHRRKGDCSDVETLVPLGSLDKDQMVNRIQKLNPKGKTPIARSVQEAVDKLRTVETTASVILVSDGLETCGGDPCQAVKDAKNAGIQFKMHVVGFDIAEADAEQLQCMAEAGGGQYFSAQNAAELTTALQKAVEPPEPEQGTLHITTKVNDRLSGAEVRIYHAETDREVVGWRRTGEIPEDNPIAYELEPGRYDLKVELFELDDKPVRTLEGIEISVGETVEKTVDIASGAIEITTKVNGELSQADVHIYHAGTDRQAAGWKRIGEIPEENPITFQLEPGTYDLKVEMIDMEDEPTRMIEGVEVTAGETVSKSVEFGSGAVEITTKVNGALRRANVRVYHAGTEREAAGWQRSGEISEDNPVRFELEPGAYDVRVKMIELGHKPTRTLEGIEITPGKTITKTVELQSGVITVTSKVNGDLERANVRVYHAGTDREAAGWQRSGDVPEDNPVRFELEPGSYDVRVKMIELGHKPSRKIEGIELAAEDTISKTVELQSGVIIVTSKVNGDLERANVRVYHAGTDREAAGWQRSGDVPEDNPVRFELEPGRYDVRVKMIELGHKPTRTIEGIELAAEETISETVELTSGIITVTTKVNGDLERANVRVYHAGTDREAAGWQRSGDVPEDNPVRFELEPGSYDVRVKMIELEGKPTQTAEGIVLEAEETVEHVFDMTDETE